jgi:hypothetical protein
VSTKRLSSTLLNIIITIDGSKVKHATTYIPSRSLLHGGGDGVIVIQVEHMLRPNQKQLSKNQK